MKLVYCVLLAPWGTAEKSQAREGPEGLDLTLLSFSAGYQPDALVCLANCNTVWVLHWFFLCFFVSLFRRLFPMFVCAQKIWDASKSSMTIVRTLHHFWASVNGPWRVWNKTYVPLKLTKTQCFRKEHRLLRMTFPFIEMFPFKSALWLCCSRS